MYFLWQNNLPRDPKGTLRLSVQFFFHTLFWINFSAICNAKLLNGQRNIGPFLEGIRCKPKPFVLFDDLRTCVSLHLTQGTYTCPAIWSFLGLGSFSIDDGDGSKNATFKTNSSFFKFCRVYSSSLRMSNVGKFPGVDYLGTALKFRKRKKNSSSPVYVLHKTCN